MCNFSPFIGNVRNKTKLTVYIDNETVNGRQKSDKNG